ncbi:MAG: InlB B-repeat-containing protein [Clostridia bacterium]|nr:InlB B-repeat-containing protein [Clostridia bacterium]
MQTASNHTLVAQWTEATYTVTYDANGGSVSPATQTKKYGSEYGTVPTPTKAGYAFAGWYLNGSKVTSDTVVSATTDHTLVASWIKNVAVVELSVENGGRDLTVDESNSARDIITWSSLGLNFEELSAIGKTNVQIDVRFDAYVEDDGYQNVELAMGQELNTFFPFVPVYSIGSYEMESAVDEWITHRFTVNVDINTISSYPDCVLGIVWSADDSWGSNEWKVGYTTYTFTVK